VHVYATIDLVISSLFTLWKFSTRIFHIISN